MKKITFLILSIAFGLTQAQTISWYQRGQDEIWEIQPDVYAFRAKDVVTYPGEIDSSLVDTSIVDTVLYWAERRDRAIEVYFKPGVSDNSKAQLISTIRSDTLFEQEYLVVTQNPNSIWQEQKWYVIDDIILVNFDSPPSEDELNNLLQNYSLEPYYYPSVNLPIGDYAYMFKLLGETPAPQTASMLIEENAGLIREATPNFSNIRLDPFRNVSASPSGGQVAACYSDDPLFNYSWHVENDGNFQLNFPSTGHVTPGSTLDADADICECWSMGYDGSGIRIGIVAGGGIDYVHQDLGNNLLQGWDCTQNPCTLLTTNTVPPTSMAMGTFLTGLVGAQKDNQRGAAGVASGAEVIPFRIDQMEAVTSWEAVIRSIDASILAQVDILVLAMWGVVDNAIFENSITNAVTLGRPISGINYGTVVLGTTGGYLGFNGGVMATYPASYSNVVSVIGANPNDKLKIASDLWDESPPLGYGCIAGDMYDFAAPTSLITSTDISFPHGYNSAGNYYTLADHQCFAAPVVTAGIAAMMLEKNPATLWTDIRQELRDGAEQVGGYAYNSSGVSVELGHGRVSCLNSITAIPASRLNAKHKTLSATVESPVQDQARIQVTGSDIPQSYHGLISSLNGDPIMSFKIPTSTGKVIINTSGLASGMYIVSIQGTKSGAWNGKLMKF